MSYLNSFWVGGLICVFAQILIDKTKLTPARILVLYVVLGVIMTATGIYEPIVKFAKSGATVPLTGFGYVMTKGVKEMIQQRG
ncbi:MAG: SpoVA/SpoVAEb family sporulation membrane protein, partial [Firmicutes bacterium]|nr:SpoVA/SpoVAEb family sporulation membrane protein [Bacillota bacterium]